MKIMHFVLYVTLSDSLSSDQDSSDDESRAPPAKKRRADDRGMYNVTRSCTYMTVLLTGEYAQQGLGDKAVTFGSILSPYTAHVLHILVIFSR